MEQNLNDLNSPALDEAALRWSCDVLGLESYKHSINKRETRRAAIVSFLNELKSNEFSADKNSAAAVELIHGKSPQGSPAYVRGQQRKQLRQLDALVRWFASQLGVQDHQQLRTSLWHQLSQFNGTDCSEQVKSYGAKIWAAAKSVESPAYETNAAAKKVLQALFHIATIRATQRNAVRRQHVVRLKKEFSEEQLTIARNTIWQNHDTPNEMFHRPFLSLLTCNEDSVDNYEIRQPVTFSATPSYQDSYSTTTSNHPTEEKSVGFGKFAVIMFCVFLAVVVKMGRFANKNQTTQPNPTWSSSVNKPSFNFDPTLDPDDPQSVESALRVLRTLEGEETELPTVEEFKGIKERAEQAKQRIKEREALLSSRRDELKSQRQRQDDAFKAMSEFIRKKEEAQKQKFVDGVPQKEAKIDRQPPTTSGDSAHDALQRHIDIQQQALDEARKRESIVPTSKAINDVMQRQIDMQQRRLDQDRESKSAAPSDPNQIVEDILQRSRERQRKMREEAAKRDAEFKQQMEEMRQRMNRSRPNLRDPGIRNRSNRIPRNPSDI